LQRTLGLSVFMVTHDLGHIIPEIDRVFLMSHGHIVADGPKDEILRVERLADLFGVAVDLTRRGGYYHMW
jgi:ABC-type cobalamin transport system ATPase subunit